MGDIAHFTRGFDVHIPFLYRIVPLSFFLTGIGGGLSLQLIRAPCLRLVGMTGHIDTAKFMFGLRILVFLRHIRALGDKFPEPFPAVLLIHSKWENAERNLDLLRPLLQHCRRAAIAAKARDGMIIGVDFTAALGAAKGLDLVQILFCVLLALD